MFYAGAILRVHHYTGSLELSQNINVTGSLAGDTLRSWLTAFIDMVGKEKALEATKRLRQWAIADGARGNAEMER